MLKGATITIYSEIERVAQLLADDFQNGKSKISIYTQTIKQMALLLLSNCFPFSPAPLFII